MPSAVAVPDSDHRCEQYASTIHTDLQHDDEDFDKHSETNDRSIFEQTYVSPPPLPPYTPPKPSIRLLYAFCTRRDLLFLVFPAVAISMLAGGMAPFMTQVIGQAFDGFAVFSTSTVSPTEAKKELLRTVGFASLELIALAAGQLAFSSLMSSLWIWVGERNAMRLRKQVYNAVSARAMTWFDLTLGGDSDTVSEKTGAGGLMAKFSHETEDVRNGCSLTAGMIIQHLVTLITCMVLAFVRSWSLTLVILSTVPLVIVIQAVAQFYGTPIYERESSGTNKAGSLLERVIANIATVKAFNAAPRECNAFGDAVDQVARDAIGSGTVWAISLGLTQFQSMALFVQAFGFGSKLVRDGKITPGDVMTVFWACLIAATSLQSALPYFQDFAKGQMAMASLIEFVERPTPDPHAELREKKDKDSKFWENANPFATMISTRSIITTTTHRSPTSPRVPQHIRGIRPQTCYGEFNFRNVTFSYPSRPSIPVLKNVSLFLPACEMTFIVGGSGSGKSTIASLLMRYYTPQEGIIELDNQGLGFVDGEWVSEHVGCVAQGGAAVWDGSVEENVLMGWGREKGYGRDKAIEACRLALMHEFVRDLTEGYDSLLGGQGGTTLSGGQRQRLAIARAWIRDPTVLILDEATSALDPTSRLLVFEAIKRWRRNKTTIVITHDLSQITPTDFVYLLKDGEVVEQGFRVDLEANESTEFRRMANTQNAVGFPQKDIPAIDVPSTSEEALLQENSVRNAHGSILRPLTGAWMFDAIAELTRPEKPSQPEPAPQPEAEQRPPLRRRYSSIESNATLTPLSIPAPAHTVGRRTSLQFEPTSPFQMDDIFAQAMVVQDDEDFERENHAVTSNVMLATTRRQRSRREVMTEPKKTQVTTILVESSADLAVSFPSEKPAGVFSIAREIYPSIPNKPLLFIGIFICFLSGAMTPLFSFMLSRLFYEVSSGARVVHTIVQYALITLAIAAADGLFAGLKSIVMEIVGVRWMTRVRKIAFKRVLAQDKAWFDDPANNPARLVNAVIKDGDDAKRLISICLSMCVVVVTMLGLGLIWALVWGWQLTLVGVGIVPVFAGAIAIQARISSVWTLKSKRAREEVSKVYYESIVNVRGIRSMSYQNVFAKQFDTALWRALRAGVQGAFVEGLSYGLTNAMIYLSEALLFYVGAILITKGAFTYLQMVQVLNLLVFSVSLAAQMMVFVDRIAKCTQAAHDLQDVVKLATDTQESRGTFRPAIRGPISFNNVTFTYPQRPDAPTLKNISLELREGECVAIVGSSGCGKSTLAALLQRLYEPSEGHIAVGGVKLSDTDVTWLRDHVSVVSQNPHLFDTTVQENIAYGASEFTVGQVRKAAKAANVHDFILSLPRDYDTVLGENASLISGGQAQRIQIARALVRPSHVLLFDECTSALDPSNQAAVMETIQRVKVGRTTVLITHNVAMMQTCDRIVVMQDGSIAEQGTYASLMARRGAFFKLASAGEWSQSA